MNDSYVELMVKRKNSLAAMLGRNILIGVGMLSIFLLLLSGMNILFLLLTVLLFGGAYLCHSQIYTEYEYLFLEKTLSIDKISNRSRRKKVAEFAFDNAEIVAPLTSHRLDQYKDRKEIKTLDYTSHIDDADVFCMIMRNGNSVSRVLIEVNDELLRQMRMAGPRKVFED